MVKPWASYLGDFFTLCFWEAFSNTAGSQHWQGHCKPTGTGWGHENPEGITEGKVLLDLTDTCGDSKCHLARTWEDGMCLLQVGWLEILSAKSSVSSVRTCELLLRGFPLNDACTSDSRDSKRHTFGWKYTLQLHLLQSLLMERLYQFL